MTPAKIAAAVAAIAAALLLSACGGPPAVTGGQPPALPGQSAADAQATIAVYQLQQQAALQATAQAEQLRAEQTRAAELATAQAVAQVTAAAQSAQDAITATAQALAVQATTQALAVEGTREALAFVATAEAEDRIAEMEHALTMAEAQRLAAEQAARLAEIDRARRINELIPWAFWIAAGIAAIVTGALVARLIAQSRPQPAGDAWVAWTKGNPQIIDVTPRRPQLSPPPALISGPAADPPAQPVALAAPPEGHILVAGETGSGKSTAMRRVLQDRANVTVLDPHSAGDDWPDARIIGAGRDFDAIVRHMIGMAEELDTRYEQRRAGVTRFDPVTVAVDEMPAIVHAAGREINEVWKAWLREGRKVGLYLVLATQSTRVRTLGIEGEGDVRDNFAMTIVLGHLARQEHPDLTQGQQWPAVAKTLEGTRPVIIDAAPATAARPPAQTLSAPATADPRAMTPADRERILRMHRVGHSLNEIQRTVFGYSGGAAYYAVNQVIGGSTDPDTGPIQRPIQGQYQPDSTGSTGRYSTSTPPGVLAPGGTAAD